MQKAFKPLFLDMLENEHARKVVIVPNARARVGIAKSIVKERGILKNVEFFTLAEYVEDYTTDTRVLNDIELLEPLEELSYMLNIINKPAHRNLFKAHQIDIDLARLLLQEYAKLALTPSFKSFLYDKYREPLHAIFSDYKENLKLENKWDKVEMFKYVIEHANCKDQIYFFTIVDYLPIEQKVLECLEGKPITLPQQLQSPLYKYKTYGDKVGIDHFIEQIVAQNHLDDVVILYTDEKLVPHIDAALSRYRLKATFSRGVPFTTVRLYEIVRALFDYVSSHYQTKYIKNILLNGEIATTARNYTSATMRQVIHMPGVEYGKRIPTIVRQYILMNEELDEEKSAQFESLASDIEILQQKLAQFDEPNASYFDIFIDVLSTFILKEKSLSKQFLITQLERLKGNVPDFDSFKQFKSFMLKELARTKWQASGEKPGHIHVAHYDDQLISYRHTAAVFGLDATAFPKLPISSPFIPADCYPTLQLRTPEQSLQHAMEKLQTVLSTVGEVHVYANIFNTHRVRYQNESLFFKQLVSTINDETVKDIPLIGYKLATLDNPVSLERTEYSEPYFVQWDEQQDGRYVNVLSPTSVQTLLHCSRRYFFEKKLYIDQVDEMQENIKTWLPANVLGTLVHEVLEKCAASYKAGATEADLLTLAESIYETYKAIYEPVTEILYTKELEKLPTLIQTFYEHLENLAAEGWEVHQVEGDITEDTIIQLNVTETESIDICIRGRIDRIDKKIDEDIYRTIDYKTGKSKNVKHLQLYLYDHSLQAQQLQVENQSAFYMVFENELIEYDDESIKEDLTLLAEKLQQLDLNHSEFDGLAGKKCGFCQFKQICSGMEANVRD